MHKDLFPDGGPAFPITDRATAVRLGQLAMEGIEDSAKAEQAYITAEARATRGMSMLDYAAIEAMKSMISGRIFTLDSLDVLAGRRQVARIAYDMAEAMVNESVQREKARRNSDDVTR